MSSKLVLILIIAVVISQTRCDANVKDKATIAKLKLTNSLNGAKNAADGLADSAKSKASDSAKGLSNKLSSGSKSAKNKLSSIKNDVVDIAKAKRNSYASLDDLIPEELHAPEEYTIGPEDIYEYVQERYPQLRSLFEDFLQVEPEDEAKPAPQEKKNE